ncbi:Zn-dependent exopeptidase [Suillus fuscotomentosus]|uniref:Peptide hydrolase n=1 Tax=Suillus fuscotomentosus TaxID=1912939 RepID=A0AAD4DWA9_9AGAM|nr:Zn-dependent exopeptidase [Suillus fuscotomentosus]KAG1893793.1 Zn-dependent exopeptidase [Suillus fuscotomentosus]
MRTFTALYALISVLFVSAAVFDQQPPQDVLGKPTVDALTDRDAIIESLLATHADDPVQVMRILDPENASELDAPRLLQVFGTEAVWMTEGDKLRLRQQGLGFIDLTDHQDLHACHRSAQSSWPKLHYQEKVTSVTELLSKDEMKKNLEKFTSFHNRYYRSEFGVKSSRWLYNQILDIISAAPPGVRLSPSIIARFEPFFGRASPNPTIALPRIIVGAHQDSANYRFPLLPAPGADDDGSGTVTILEAFRALVQSGFAPERPVEFHWYAAEEGGLLGSQEVVSEYKQLKKEVGAMIQFDMTAYVPKGEVPVVTFISTDVDSNLTNWAIGIAEEYSTSAVGSAKLFPGAGSDHMSWYRAGYPAIFAAEGDPFKTFNPYIHTAGDKIDLADGEFSFEHALEFAKVAVGFVVELGGWVE